MLIDYSRATGVRTYRPVIANTFLKAQRRYPGFVNSFYDDDGWWALAWIDAYDLTRNPRYLSMAESIFAAMTGGWDTSVCGGGLWWNKDRKYKNAIANELFLSVAAHLANRARDRAQRERYLAWAEREWRWFRSSGMIDARGLIADGMDSTNPSACRPALRGTRWSYNQGVILGALLELNRADRDPELVREAQTIAQAALRYLTDSRGILRDVCEPACGQDGNQFKGIFVRNLAALNRAFPEARYSDFLRRNAGSVWRKSRNRDNQFGVVWPGPPSPAGAASQSSALDALVAAIGLPRTP